MGKVEVSRTAERVLKQHGFSVERALTIHRDRLRTALQDGEPIGMYETHIRMPDGDCVRLVSATGEDGLPMSLDSDVSAFTELESMVQFRQIFLARQQDMAESILECRRDSVTPENVRDVIEELRLVCKL